MADNFIGEIRIFPFNFAPSEWAMCNGQLLSISQNTALFALLGTNFGGNGTSNFGLPNLEGNVAMDWGNGAGLTPRVIGEDGGTATVTVLETELPAHSHTPSGQSGAATSTDPTGGVPGTSTRPTYAVVPSSGASSLNAGAVKTAGDSEPHNNLQPYLVLNFCIALAGIFPTRG